MSKQNIGYIDLQFSIINLQFTETASQQKDTNHHAWTSLGDLRDDAILHCIWTDFYTLSQTIIDGLSTARKYSLPGSNTELVWTKKNLLMLSHSKITSMKKDDQMILASF